MIKLTYVKFGLDILMAVTFVLFFNKRVLGGLTFHEMAGLAIAAIFFTHVLLNWKWVKKVSVRLFDRKLPFKTKLGYLLNILLLISMAFIIISGILISRVVFPNINIGNEHWFKVTHISISFLVLIFVAAHIGLHWKWIMNVFKNLIKFKTPRRYAAIFTRIATAAIFIFGIYQMYSTNFFVQLQGVTRVFNLSTSQFPNDGFQGGDGHFERTDFSEENLDKGDHPLQKPNFSEGNFREGGQFGKTDHLRGGFKGENGHTGDTNALSVIIEYSGIMSVIIIVVYYLDKLIIQFKRKKSQAKFETTTNV